MKHALVGLVLCQAAALTFAQGHAAPPPTDSHAGFECGGVGQSEQAYFKEMARRHDALVTFATPRGAYLADVDVVVTGPRGRVVTQGHCDGPLMLLDVPRDGRYRIEADYHGHHKERTVALGEHPARLSFTWDAS